MSIQYAVKFSLHIWPGPQGPGSFVEDGYPDCHPAASRATTNLWRGQPSHTRSPGSGGQSAKVLLAEIKPDKKNKYISQSLYFCLLLTTDSADTPCPPGQTDLHKTPAGHM